MLHEVDRQVGKIEHRRRKASELLDGIEDPIEQTRAGEAIQELYQGMRQRIVSTGAEQLDFAM